MIHVLWILAANGVLLTTPGPAPLDTGRTAVPEAAHGATAEFRSAPSAEAGPRSAPRFQPFVPGFLDSAATPQRPRAIEYSDFYYARLAIHRIASWATLPLFAGEYYLGTKLYNNPPGSRATQEWHRAVADGVAGLFVVNTLTGAWNLWDSRKDPAGRTRRWIHAALMIAADAGFVATGATAPSPRRILFSATPVNLSTHRTIAMASMGTALASYAMMLIWKN